VIKSPAVSVIMTVYNGERYLAQAIDSIRRQSLDDFEFVIVDDGSEDRTPEILAEAQTDPRIKVILQPRLGRARALNLAWTHTKGAYVANLDADDLAEPIRLEKQFNFLQQHPQVGLLGTAWRQLNENTKDEWLLRPPLTDPELRNVLLRRNPFLHSSVMIPRHVLEEVGGYNERFHVSIDYELWVRIACHYRLANLPDILAVQRTHRQAYFCRFLLWERYKPHVMIRWCAWRRFSRSAAELRFVFDPTDLPREFVAVRFPQCAELYRKLVDRLKKEKQGTE
jgi:glycosyltransferase involved in cell wall biosynthesis